MCRPTARLFALAARAKPVAAITAASSVTLFEPARTRPAKSTPVTQANTPVPWAAALPLVVEALEATAVEALPAALVLQPATSAAVPTIMPATARRRP